MIYKHETDIEHILRENDFLTTDEKFAPVFREFLEVYRKAKAFDQLAHTYERYRHSHEHDLKLLLGMKAIELLEADE